MVDHLEHAAAHAFDGQGEHAHDDEAQVAHGRTGDEALDVGLGPSEERTINDADRTQRHEHRGGCERGSGEQPDAEANQAVGSHLQENSCKEHRAGSRCFRVSIREPGVER